jgi:HSP90 family molecular chaperone
VSDVASLVRRLGGAELYGADKTAAFRELLVNACDAVKARQALAEYRGKVFDGRVIVTLAKDGCLEVTDNGIGMSPEVLTGPLLDFGRSSWLSNEVIQGNPGLAASQFTPTGRFGIGFLSVFMLGERIKVISRSTNAGPEDTWVLELRRELTQRPVLRRAHTEEQLDQPGTTMRVHLDDGFVGPTGT